MPKDKDYLKKREITLYVSDELRFNLDDGQYMIITIKRIESPVSAIINIFATFDMEGAGRWDDDDQ